MLIFVLFIDKRNIITLCIFPTVCHEIKHNTEPAPIAVVVSSLKFRMLLGSKSCIQYS